MTTVTFFPSFPDRLTLTSHLYRAVWALLPAIDHIDTVILPYDGSDRALLDVDQLCHFAHAFLPKDFDPAISDIAPRYANKLSFDGQQNADVLIVWDLSDDATLATAEQLASQTGGQVVRADPVLWERELIDLILLAFDAEPDHVALRRTGDHYARFVLLSRACRDKPMHLFATGPLVQGLVEQPPDIDGISMVCNALIQDAVALEAFKPTLLAAGDPVQHNGPSRTAGAFRHALAAALASKDRYALVPLGFVPYLEATLPADLHEHIIGIPTAAVPGWNLDLVGQFATATTANVLTMLMLPVAMSFSKQATLYGCDGKPDKTEGAPWRHRDEPGYQAAMESSTRLHPAFWAKDFGAEYQDYCSNLESMLTQAEGAGAEIRAATPSHIPALRARGG